MVISGCSEGGKSTLLAELARRGYRIVKEPGRRIVAEALERGGSELPWMDPMAFAKRALAMARANREAAPDAPGWTFFDRGLIDTAVALEHLARTPAGETLGADRYHRRVFLAPPWPAIYKTDPDRQHGLKDAIAEYDRLATAYPRPWLRRDHVAAHLGRRTRRLGDQDNGVSVRMKEVGVRAIHY